MGRSEILHPAPSQDALGRRSRTERKRRKVSHAGSGEAAGGGRGLDQPERSDPRACATTGCAGLGRPRRCARGALGCAQGRGREKEDVEGGYVEAGIVKEGIVEEGIVAGCGRGWRCAGALEGRVAMGRGSTHESQTGAGGAEGRGDPEGPRGCWRGAVAPARRTLGPGALARGARPAGVAPPGAEGASARLAPGRRSCGASSAEVSGPASPRARFGAPGVRAGCGHLRLGERLPSLGQSCRCGR